ncbi:hypothetical protein M2480_000171 [Parabacteroides sp. PFB2-12]|nr:hypothetical protein [Parabacteroides sp. PM6-13]MDH6389213.1 hypothetical protein [Parabacteroides sp. PFB2-12]
MICSMNILTYKKKKRMKKIVCFAVMAIALVACGTTRSLDLRKLTTGMSKAQVEQLAGYPNRMISFKETSNGVQEVLEYQTAQREVYALEFWNDYLVGYEYLYEDVTYVAPVNPPVHYPPYGRPIYIAPNRPNRPRPGEGNDRPSNNRPSHDRPSNDRPSHDRPSDVTRPTTRPSIGSRPVGTQP